MKLKRDNRTGYFIASYRTLVVIRTNPQEALDDLYALIVTK